MLLNCGENKTLIITVLYFPLCSFPDIKIAIVYFKYSQSVRSSLIAIVFILSCFRLSVRILL
jgi:hypothetical protein